jgi:hypothetical protein
VSGGDDDGEEEVEFLHLKAASAAVASEVNKSDPCGLAGAIKLTLDPVRLDLGTSLVHVAALGSLAAINPARAGNRAGQALDETKPGLVADRTCVLRVAVAAVLVSMAGAPPEALFDLVGGKTRLEELADKPVASKLPGAGGAAPTKTKQQKFVGNKTLILQEERQRELSITLAVHQNGTSALNEASIETIVTQAWTRYNAKDQALLSVDESTVVAMGFEPFKHRATAAIKSWWNQSGDKSPANMIRQKFMLDNTITKGGKRCQPLSCTSPEEKRSCTPTGANVI